MKKSYSLVDPMVFMTEEEYTEKVELMQKDDKTFPDIFIKLNEGQFQNWFIHLTDMKTTEKENENMSIKCEYYVAQVPKGIDDKNIKKLKQNLDVVMNEVFSDMIDESMKLMMGS